MFADITGVLTLDIYMLKSPGMPCGKRFKEWDEISAMDLRESGHVGGVGLLQCFGWLETTVVTEAGFCGQGVKEYSLYFSVRFVVKLY